MIELTEEQARVLQETGLQLDQVQDDDRDRLLQDTLLKMEALRESPDEAAVQGIERWLRESPLHAASFLRQLLIDDALRQLTRSRSLAEWIEMAREAYKDLRT